MSIETFGRYQLLELIATGGMAQIFLARMLGASGFEKLVVIKRILPHLAGNEEFIRMFLDEARIAARLNHPNVVQIFDLGFQDETYFIAMEYIHGEDVRRVWKKAQSLSKEIPISLACRVVMDACAGLNYAHKKEDATGKSLGIIHRDISPQNILIGFEGGVKIVDFGIAKATNKMNVTRAGVIKGKYAYMSPEQAQGRPLDARSDIFSLGILLFELLTGKRLFRRSTDLQTLAAAAECNVVAPSQFNSKVSEALDAIVLRALKKDPNERYASANDLQLDLEACLTAEGQPASTAHLSAFMKELYAERLAREASQGQIFIEESQSDVAKESSAPKNKLEAQVGYVADQTTRLKGPEDEQNFSVTQDVSSTERPPAEFLVPSPPGLKEGVPPDSTHSSSKRDRTRVGLALAIIFLAMLVFWMTTWGRGENAPLTSSSPQEVGSPSPNTEVDASLLGLPRRVLLEIRSEPPGASLWLDGRPQGQAPFTYAAMPDELVRLRAMMDGYKETERMIQVTSEPTQEILMTLEPVPRPETPKEETKPNVARGQVRFVVTPWAEVSCDGKGMGQTPFSPKWMSPGVYQCVFVHPSLGTRRERVIVRANEIKVVTVKF